jgi:hypothetical protein
MKLTQRRQFLRLAVGAAALPGLSRMAGAQAGPARPKIGTRVITLAPISGRTHAAQNAAFAGADIMTEEHLSQRVKGLARAFNYGEERYESANHDRSTHRGTSKHG